MANPPQFNQTGAFRPGENSKFKKPETGTSGEKPVSLYQSRTAPPSPGSQPQTSAFKRPSAPGAFGTQTDTASTRPFSSLRAQNTASEAPRPFTSLRAQSQTPDATRTSATASRFARPAATQGGTGSSFDQRAGGTAVAGAARPPRPADSARAASPFRKDLHITDEEFVLLRDFIYQQCGIFIAENRKYLVENRLSNRLKELNLKSYNEYYNYLRFDNNKKQELTKLFEVVTTNETSFFRNPPQLDVFQRIVLAEAIDQARKQGQKKLRIWSAGCSTGEEPYTLAIILHETLKTDIGNWDIKITANDLSEAVLAAARRGIYNEYALRTTPKEMVDRYFHKEGNVYKIDSALKRLVSFGQINLSDREQLKRVDKSQIVFCRNVIIYFDDDMKRRVINAFYDNLMPSGVLIIGHSESLHNISRAFQLEHHKGTILYRKSS